MMMSGAHPVSERMGLRSLPRRDVMRSTDFESVPYRRQQSSEAGIPDAQDRLGRMLRDVSLMLAGLQQFEASDHWGTE